MINSVRVGHLTNGIVNRLCRRRFSASIRMLISLFHTCKWIILHTRIIVAEIHHIHTHNYT